MKYLIDDHKTILDILEKGNLSCTYYDLSLGYDAKFVISFVYPRYFRFYKQEKQKLSGEELKKFEEKYFIPEPKEEYIPDVDIKQMFKTGNRPLTDLIKKGTIIKTNYGTGGVIESIKKYNDFGEYEIQDYYCMEYSVNCKKGYYLNHYVAIDEKILHQYSDDYIIVIGQAEKKEPESLFDYFEQ